MCPNPQFDQADSIDSHERFVLSAIASPVKWHSRAVEEQLQDMGAMTQNLKELATQHQYMKKTVQTPSDPFRPPGPKDAPAWT